MASCTELICPEDGGPGSRRAAGHPDRPDAAQGPGGSSARVSAPSQRRFRACSWHPHPVTAPRSPSPSVGPGLQGAHRAVQGAGQLVAVAGEARPHCGRREGPAYQSSASGCSAGLAAAAVAGPASSSGEERTTDLGGGLRPQGPAHVQAEGPCPAVTRKGATFKESAWSCTCLALPPPRSDRWPAGQQQCLCRSRDFVSTSKTCCLRCDRFMEGTSVGRGPAAQPGCRQGDLG